MPLRDTTITSPSNDAAITDVDQLHALARRIKERNRLAEQYAYAQWLENGRDLLNAKALIGHGDFGEWCERELSYSARTAQKLMRAAEVWGPYFKNEFDSVLPKPTIVYALSAPSVSQEIRDNYAPRVIAGEDVDTELRIAIQDHRDAVKKAKEREVRLAAELPEAQQAQVKRDKANARREAREAEQRQIEQERQANARSAALALILARFGDDLPALIALAVEAGSGSVFNFQAERELLNRLQEKTMPVGEAAEDNGAEAKALLTDVPEEGHAPEEGQPIEPELMAVLSSPTPPLLPAPVADADKKPPGATKADQPPSQGKYGDLRPVVSPFRSTTSGPKHSTVPKTPRPNHSGSAAQGRPVGNSA